MPSVPRPNPRRRSSPIRAWRRRWGKKACGRRWLFAAVHRILRFCVPAPHRILRAGTSPHACTSAHAHPQPQPLSPHTSPFNAASRHTHPYAHDHSDLSSLYPSPFTGPRNPRWRRAGVRPFPHPRLSGRIRGQPPPQLPPRRQPVLRAGDPRHAPARRLPRHAPRGCALLDMPALATIHMPALAAVHVVSCAGQGVTFGHTGHEETHTGTRNICTTKRTAALPSP